MTEPEGLLLELLNRARRDQARWINGDAQGYTLPPDGTILGAVGGFGFGGPETAGRQQMVAAQWAQGTGSIEFLNGGVSSDLAWLTFLERSQVKLRDEQDQRRWDLRVTEIFRRIGSDWERVHRHADPLVDRRSVLEAAALLHTQ